MPQSKNKTLSLRSFKGKKLVSYLRNGDYAHAGEVESIIQVMQRYPKNKNQTILDMGCGLGGTADFIQKNGWGKVTGVDIESDSINFAKQKYPDIEFYISDVVNISDFFPKETFDLICLFNSFYAFLNQQNALCSLYNVAKKHANLVIFDYSSLSSEVNTSFNIINGLTMPFNPIKTISIKNILLETGWRLAEMQDISDDYIRWYNNLVSNLTKNQKLIISEFGQDAYDKAYTRYTEIYNAILEKRLGGAIIYAEKRA